jgi:hypothetical protein
MATFNLNAPLVTTAPYAGMVGRTAQIWDWPTTIAANGNYSGSGNIGIMFSWGGFQDIPSVGPIYYVDCVWNLSSLGGATISEATITFDINSTSPFHPFPTDNTAGLALVGQNESLRSHQNLNINSYEAIYQGRTNEYAQRVPYSSLTGYSSVTFTINSAGLAYLNSVYTKPTLTNYACFGITFGAVADNVTPTLMMSGSYVACWMENVYLNLTTGATFGKINIGDSWKDIEEVKINIGDTWKDVEEWKINIGDSWKDPED